jgi:hypothetical protein
VVTRSGCTKVHGLTLFVKQSHTLKERERERAKIIEEGNKNNMDRHKQKKKKVFSQIFITMNTKTKNLKNA